MKKKTLIGIAIVVILAVVGAVALIKYRNKETGTQNATSSAQSYVSFAGDYSFLVPDGYMIDDSSIPGSQLILKKNEKLEVQSVDEIYSKGVLAAQSFTPILNDNDAFKNYVSNTLKDAVAKSLKGTSEATFGKKGNVTTAVIKTTVNGGLVRIQYILNSSKPVILASGNDDATFQSISNSLDTASKNTEFTTIQNTVLTVTSLVKNRMDSDTYRLSTDGFKAKTSLDDLKKLLDQTPYALKANVSITGGVMAGSDFTASLLYTKLAEKSGDQPKSAVGTISLKKEGGQWELAGLTLPTNDSLTATATK